MSNNIKETLEKKVNGWFKDHTPKRSKEDVEHFKKEFLEGIHLVKADYEKWYNIVYDVKVGEVKKTIV